MNKIARKRLNNLEVTWKDWVNNNPQVPPRYTPEIELDCHSIPKPGAKKGTNLKSFIYSKLFIEKIA